LTNGSNFILNGDLFFLIHTKNVLQLINLAKTHGPMDSVISKDVGSYKILKEKIRRSHDEMIHSLIIVGKKEKQNRVLVVKEMPSKI